MSAPSWRASTIAIIRELVSELDVPPDRVDVEVTVAEVTLSEGYTFGLSVLTPLIDTKNPDDLIAFLVSDSGNTVIPGLANVLAGGTTAPIDFIPDGTLQSVLTYDPLSIPIVGPGGTSLALAAAGGIDASEVGVTSRSLLRPRLSLLNGEEHEIFSGDNVPIAVSNTAGGGGQFDIRQNIERYDVGVVLRLQSTLASADLVVLDLDLEVSGVALSQDAVAGTGVIIQERTLSTRARLQPGQVAVVAWVGTPQVVHLRTGIPYLQSLPVIGWIFRRTEELSRSNHLLVLARAKVHRPEVPALTQWMREAIESQDTEVSLESTP